MNVLLIGAHGYLGPHVARALAAEHRLRITDVKPPPAELRAALPGQQFAELDVTDADAVLRAAEGMDAIVNLAVVRGDPVLAFRVNTLGCYHVMQAAARHGIRRLINTGPHFCVAGPSYEGFDHGIGPDAPPHPGTLLYALSKSLGLEVCRAMSEGLDLYVQTYLFYTFRAAEEVQPGRGGVPFVVSWADAGELFRLGLAVELAKLPSRCEVFFILADLPQGKFLGDKARRVLGFQSRDAMDGLWRRPA
jgi:hypothetical protein